MKKTVNRSALMSWIIIFCMIVPMLIPVFAFAQTDDGVISVDGQAYAMSVMPEIDELGIMVSAKDAADAFSLEYDFDSENKAFEIYDEAHGKIVLMHNATMFYSGESVYECAPYFYVRNGEPMVEIGFFCNMFAASYEYEEEGNKIIVDRNKISDDVAKVKYNGNVTPLYMEPMKKEYGLLARTEDLANCFGLDYEYDETGKTAVLTDENGDSVELTDGASSFKSSCGEFECGTFFNVINDMPMVEVGFFCDLYGVSYEYDEETKTLSIFDEMTMTEKFDDEAFELFSSDAIISGNVNYPEGAPSGGMNVKLILQQTGTRYQMYQGYTYYTGSNYVLGTVKLAEGETIKSFAYDVSGYYTSTYPTYALYYEESSMKEYGYCNLYSTTSTLTYSPFNSSAYNHSARQFSYSSDYTVNFVIGKNYVSGSVSLDDDQLAPSGGIDADLILQTRTKTYTGLYGANSYYSIGSNYNLGTVTIPKGSNSAKYKFDISDCFDNTGYSYYSLYYSSEGNDCVVPYGYYNNLGTVTSISSIPTSGNCYYTGARAFYVVNYEDVDFTLPIQSGYVPDTETVEAPTSNAESGDVTIGTYISLSTSTSGADIYYTTDGTTPTASSKKYTSPIEITADVTIKAIAVKSGMINSDVVTFSYKAISVGVPAVKVGSKFGKAGKTVDVIISLENNPGIAVLGFDVGYDSNAMTLQAVTVNDVFTSADITAGDISKNPYTVSAMNAAENNLKSGNLITLTFLIKETCAEGDYEVSITAPEAYTIDEDEVELNTINGTVTVRSVEPGDVTGDGIINRMDLLRLGKYFAGWDVEIDEAAADVTGDGKVNRMDLLRLGKYFAGWEVQLGQ